jgi:cell division transport system permease protein
MFFTHLKRTIRSGYNNFKRSGFTSFASTLMMVVTLFVITSLIFIQVALQSSLNEVKEKVDVTVYFTPGASEEEIFEVKDALANLPEIKDITYTSDIEALDKFKEKHSNDYLTLQALDELNENPLGATLNIKAKDPSKYENISEYFVDSNSLSKGALTIIDKVDYRNNKVVIDRLNSIIDGAGKLGFALSFVLVLISITITFNTIRLIIYMSRDEINVMRLVGAGKKYVQGPFIVSGILVGLIASVVTIIMFIPISIWLGNEMTDFIGVNLFNYFKTNFIEIFAILLITGVLLSGISSYLAVMRYLNKIK